MTRCMCGLSMGAPAMANRGRPAIPHHGFSLMIVSPFAREDRDEDSLDREPHEGGDHRYARTESHRKLSKEEAGYQDAAPCCGACAMFSPPSGCTLVKGSIDPDAVCEHFEPATEEDDEGGHRDRSREQ